MLRAAVITRRPEGHVAVCIDIEGQVSILGYNSFPSEPDDLCRLKEVLAGHPHTDNAQLLEVSRTGSCFGGWPISIMAALAAEAAENQRRQDSGEEIVGGKACDCEAGEALRRYGGKQKWEPTDCPVCSGSGSAPVFAGDVGEGDDDDA